ncbi:MAG: hypothetical protein WD960_12240 [Gemmatimonadota bacterium]
MRLRLLLPALLLGAFPLASCDPGFPGSEGSAAIDTETFIESYVDLRHEAMYWETSNLPDSTRTRILVERGVTEADLREFIAVHGRNVPMMEEVWLEVRNRVEEATEPDEDPSGPGASAS